MVKLFALIVLTLLGSCSHALTADDRSSISAAVINTLYSQIQDKVSAVAICGFRRADVPHAVLAKIKVQSIPLIKCAGVESSAPDWRLRIKGSSKLAVELSVDKVTFASPTTATVVASYSYGGLDAEGFTFTVHKYNQDWHVAKQVQLWVS